MRSGEGLSRRQLPGHMSKQRRSGTGRRRGSECDAMALIGRSEERRRDLRVDPLVVLHLPVAEIEEGLPADEAPRRAEASAEVVGVGPGLRDGSKTSPKNGLPSSPARLAR